MPAGPLDLLALLEPRDLGLWPADGPRRELYGAAVLGPPVPRRQQEEGEGGAGQRGRRVLNDPASFSLGFQSLNLRIFINFSRLL